MKLAYHASLSRRRSPVRIRSSAPQIIHPLDRVFFYGKYAIFIAFLYNLCHYIANWTGKSKEFYNKIPDNVRERIPSVMVRNREQFNPSDSSEKTIFTRRRVIKAGGIALVAGVIDACGAKKVPDAKQTTPAPIESSIGPEPEKPTESPTPETQEVKMEFVGLEDFARNLKSLEDKFKNATDKEKEEGNYYTDRIKCITNWVFGNHGYKSETFDSENGYWLATADNYEEVQSEISRTIMTAIYDGGMLAYAYKNDNSLLPSEIGMTADDIMNSIIDAYTIGYAKSELKRINFEQSYGTTKAQIYGDTIEKGELVKPIKEYFGERHGNAFSERKPEDPEADILQPVGGGIRDTVDSLFACFSKKAKDGTVNKTSVIIINAEIDPGENKGNLFYLNKPLDKSTKGHGAPEDGKTIMLSGVLSDLRTPSIVCDNSHVVKGKGEKILFCEIPEVKEFYDTQKPR